MRKLVTFFSVYIVLVAVAIHGNVSGNLEHSSTFYLNVNRTSIGHKTVVSVRATNLGDNGTFLFVMPLPAGSEVESVQVSRGVVTIDVPLRWVGCNGLKSCASILYWRSTIRQGESLWARFIIAGFPERVYVERNKIVKFWRE